MTLEGQDRHRFLPCTAPLPRACATASPASTRSDSASVKDITDKGYYTNSYHVDVREKIDAFSKFAIESQFQRHFPRRRHQLCGDPQYAPQPGRP